MVELDKCPRCGFDDVIKKNVEKLLRGGGDVAAVVVSAWVCLHCGERMYSMDTVRRFEKIRKQLDDRQVAEFEPMGHLYRVPDGYAEVSGSEVGVGG